METKSLDGETNLKGRSVPKLLLNLTGARPEITPLNELGNLAVDVPRRADGSQTLWCGVVRRARDLEGKTCNKH